MKPYMLKKPVKQGFKVWVRANSSSGERDTATNPNTGAVYGGSDVMLDHREQFLVIFDLTQGWSGACTGRGGACIKEIVFNTII